MFGGPVLPLVDDDAARALHLGDRSEVLFHAEADDGARLVTRRPWLRDAGTTMRALSFGVPLVVMPANPFIDQKGVGAVVQRQGAGILLRKHSRPAHIRAAVEKVLEDPSYRESAGRLGDRIRERDGAQVAADSILQFAGVPG